MYLPIIIFLQKMGEVIQDLPVTSVALYTLGIWGGAQNNVVVAYMDKYLYDRHYTVAVIARHALSCVNFWMANDHFDTSFIYLLCPTPEDADRLNNITWHWMGERVLFCRVLRLTLIGYGEFPPLGEVIQEGL